MLVSFGTARCGDLNDSIGDSPDGRLDPVDGHHRHRCESDMVPIGTFAASRAAIACGLCDHRRLGSQGFTMCDLDRWESGLPPFPPCPERMYTREG